MISLGSPERGLWDACCACEPRQIPRPRRRTHSTFIGGPMVFISISSSMKSDLRAGLNRSHRRYPCTPPKPQAFVNAGQGFVRRDSLSSSLATRCSNLPASLGSRLAMRSSSTASSSNSSPPAIICNRRSRVISAFLNVP
jgi:hypothetical protein